jgi:hypothetical protein
LGEDDRAPRDGFLFLVRVFLSVWTCIKGKVGHEKKPASFMFFFTFS